MMQEQATSRVTTARGGHCPTPYTSPASAQGQPAPSTAPFYPDPPHLTPHALPSPPRRPHWQPAAFYFFEIRHLHYTSLFTLYFLQTVSSIAGCRKRKRWTQNHRALTSCRPPASEQPLAREAAAAAGKDFGSCSFSLHVLASPSLAFYT